MISSPIEPIFTRSPLDRMDLIRAQVLDKRLAQLDCVSHRYLLLWQNQVLLDPTTHHCFFRAAELADAVLKDPSCVFLGEYNEQQYFTLAVDPQRVPDFICVSIRQLVADQLLVEEQLGILAQANSLLSWHQNHGFCARCGAASRLAHGGWRRDCPQCQAQHFPRTDPVVIMLVTHGDHCLLGAGHQFESNRVSCLAGFMEPGETIAQAALRELWEEAGVRGDKVTFMYDQPWPFPSNLMIGVHINALDRQLNIDHNELSRAFWASKSEVRAVLEGAVDRDFAAPLKIAIARNLLQSWVDGAIG